MFEIYRALAQEFKMPVRNPEYDLKFYKILKKMITQLIVVKPANRMKLLGAREKLLEMSNVLEIVRNDYDFFLLNPFFQRHDDFNAIDENSQISCGLMNDIRSTRLFTLPTTGHEKKLTQRGTNLCVPISAMRLLSFALVEFLEQHITGDVLTKLKDKILKNPQVPESSEQETDADQLQKESHFIHKLIVICCGVISPRSLNGLNHCYLDNEFQTIAQEQNIRELIQEKQNSIITFRFLRYFVGKSVQKNIIRSRRMEKSSSFNGYTGEKCNDRCSKNKARNDSNRSNFRKKCLR